MTLNLAICLRIPSDSTILYADETLLHFCLQFYSISFYFFFLQLGFTACKAEQPLLRGIELKEKKVQKD